MQKEKTVEIKRARLTKEIIKHGYLYTLIEADGYRPVIHGSPSYMGFDGFVLKSVKKLQKC